MRLRPFLRGKSWKDKLKLPDSPQVLPEAIEVPERVSQACFLMALPGCATLLAVAMREYLEEPFYRLNKAQATFIALTGALFQGTIAGACMLKGLACSNSYLFAVPLAVFGQVCIERESWVGFGFYTLTQIGFAFHATRLASALCIPPWIMPGFLGLIMVNCSLSLHVLFRLSSKERYCLRLEKTIQDMQENCYKPSNSLRV